MMSRLTLCALLLIAAALSSFTVVCADDSSKSEEHAGKDTADSSSREDNSKEKRSREEIMFGNQQNKPNGLVDDLMGMAENGDEDNTAQLLDKKAIDFGDDSSSEDASKEIKDDKRASHPQQSGNELLMESGADNYYNTVPVPSGSMQYLPNPPMLQSLSPEDFTRNLYEQDDLYRRKRAALRKRSLRSSLGQMIQKRGLRMPRRSNRLKRQVEVENLLNLLGKERYYDEQPLVSEQNDDAWAKNTDKRRVPSRIPNYPETPTLEFPYPYTFKHRDGGILSSGSDFEDNNPETLDDGNMDDIDNLMLLPPNSRFSEGSDVGLLPYRSREEENEAIQKWLSRHTTPSVFKVSRRAAPLFYPLDYRYVPFKKRSVFSHGNRMDGRFEDEPADADVGKWGHVVQVPEAYASAEDVARLYGLANLMAEGDDSEGRVRRAA